MTPSAGEPLRLMAVHAHPDDESSKGAATMAHYVRQGVEVMVATCTGGERGSILNAEMEGHPHADRDLTGLRRHEMARAAATLDVQHRWLGFMDSGLPEGDPLPPLPWGCFALQPLERAAAPLVRLVRRFRPHVILTYDENGGYPHPDHVMTHTVSVAAFEAAGDAGAYPHAGEPWQPLKLYYHMGFTLPRTRALWLPAAEFPGTWAVGTDRAALALAAVGLDERRDHAQTRMRLRGARDRLLARDPERGRRAGLAEDRHRLHARGLVDHADQTATQDGRVSEEEHAGDPAGIARHRCRHN